MHERQHYSTDLTDAQWALLEPFFPAMNRADHRNGRPRVYSYREVLKWHLLHSALGRSLVASGFVVLPRRWVVERTFAWLGHYKRLAKDYKFNPVHSESMIYAAMTHYLLYRLA